MDTLAAIDFQQNSIIVTGELNFTTVPQLWKTSLLKLEGYVSLYFDFAHVTQSNSAGVALIIEWIRYAKEQHKAISFHNLPENLLSILSISGVSSLLT